MVTELAIREANPIYQDTSALILRMLEDPSFIPEPEGCRSLIASESEFVTGDCPGIEAYLSEAYIQTELGNAYFDYFDFLRGEGVNQELIQEMEKRLVPKDIHLAPELFASYAFHWREYKHLPEPGLEKRESENPLKDKPYKDHYGILVGQKALGIYVNELVAEIEKVYPGIEIKEEQRKFAVRLWVRQIVNHELTHVLQYVYDRNSSGNEGICLQDDDPRSISMAGLSLEEIPRRGFHKIFGRGSINTSLDPVRRRLMRNTDLRKEQQAQSLSAIVTGEWVKRNSSEEIFIHDFFSNGNYNIGPTEVAIPLRSTLAFYFNQRYPNRLEVLRSFLFSRQKLMDYNRGYEGGIHIGPMVKFDDFHNDILRRIDSVPGLSEDEKIDLKRQMDLKELLSLCFPDIDPGEHMIELLKAS